MELKRGIEQQLFEAIEDTPVLMITGARQSGKSTLVKDVFQKTHDYISLDNATVLSNARNDPMGFVRRLDRPVILDEVQRVPELLLAIKHAVDENRRPGYFVLTGSANVLTLPKVSDSLAGRIEVHTLWPFSQNELNGKLTCFVDELFSKEIRKQKLEQLKREELVDKVTSGGYYNAIQRKSWNRRVAWFESYLISVLGKDIQELAHIERLQEMPDIFKLLAARVGNTMNQSELSRSIKIPTMTLKRYLVLLQQIYILVMLPAWSKNLSKRLVKSPKIFLNDTGLLCHLLFYDNTKLLSDSSAFGHVFENFVVMEIIKQQTWSKTRFKPYHYRTEKGEEIDLILESADSRLVGIEIKLSETITPKDVRALVNFRDEHSKNFHRGIVFYTGEKILPLSEKISAVPVQALWGG